jgi:hypothetical protein
MPVTDWSVIAINLGSSAAMALAGFVIHACVFIALERIAATGHRLLEDR